MRRLQLLESNTNVVLKEFFFEDKPDSFVLGDFGLTAPQVSSILETGSADHKYGDEWVLDEIIPIYSKSVHNWDGFIEIIEAITYKPGWYFRHGIEDGRMWVQVGVTEEAEIAFDPISKEQKGWRGAKHFLSPHMCRQEVVGTVLHAIERAEMHEVHEWFRYKGRSIYNPHLDPDALVEVARYKQNFNTRENAMMMEGG